MRKELFLVRGVSGSGKNTLAEALAYFSSAPVLSADNFFMVDGEYKFDPSKLKEAHADCRTKTEFEMGVVSSSMIFVANTFTREWEMKAYYDLAEKYGYRVHSIIVENRHGGVNEHDVPEETIQAMRDRFEIKL